MGTFIHLSERAAAVHTCLILRIPTHDAYVLYVPQGKVMKRWIRSVCVCTKCVLQSFCYRIISVWELHIFFWKQQNIYMWICGGGRKNSVIFQTSNKWCRVRRAGPWCDLDLTFRDNEPWIFSLYRAAEIFPLQNLTSCDFSETSLLETIAVMILNLPDWVLNNF